MKREVYTLKAADSERRAWETAAAKVGLRTSTWARRCLNDISQRELSENTEEKAASEPAAR